MCYSEHAFTVAAAEGLRSLNETRLINANRHPPKKLVRFGKPCPLEGKSGYVVVRFEPWSIEKWPEEFAHGAP